jgi:hypothetical protein
MKLGNLPCMGEKKSVHKMLAGNSPLGKPKLRRENTIKMDHERSKVEIGDWIQVARDRNNRRAVVCTIIIVRVS